MSDVTICDFGCSSVDGCTGKCHPEPLVRTGKYCRYCDQGERLTNGEHWIVKSIVPARIDIRTCAAYAKASQLKP